MNLFDIIQRAPAPASWSEGEKIPWGEPGFSSRMLLEHLSQQHDAASRRFVTIDQHVAWINSAILAGQPSQILDLGCGPGLYSSRLAKLGHTCLGLDFSPASIAHAQETARAEALACTYLQCDIRTADYGQGYNLAMLIFGEINTFRPADAAAILKKAHQAMAAGGRLLLEAHTFDAVQASGEQEAHWYSSAAGLFSNRPHLCLTEGIWDSQQNESTTRYYIVDGATGAVTRYASSMRAYTEAQYRELLESCGFETIVFHPSLRGGPDETQRGYLAIVCQKP